MNKFEPIDHSPLTTAHQDTDTPEHGDTQTFSLFASSSQHSVSSSIQLILYLIPIMGFFPSLWTLYRRQGSKQQLATSRLSITLALLWLLGYLFLATGAANLDFVAVRLLILNSFLTSGYFLVSLWLIFLTVRGKSRRLPGFNRFAERVVGKYLS